MSPKYVIFLVPIIIIWIVIKISKIKYSNYLLLFITILSLINYIININNYQMSRPPTKDALKIINKKNNIKLIYANEHDIYKNYLKTKKIFKKNNFQLIDLKNISKNEKFWFICLNNPRFAVGDQILPTEEKCKIFDNNNKFTFQQKIILPDILLIEYLKKN